MQPTRIVLPTMNISTLFGGRGSSKKAMKEEHV